MSTVIVNLVGLGLIVWIVWYFWLSSPVLLVWSWPSGEPIYFSCSRLQRFPTPRLSASTSGF